MFAASTQPQFTTQVFDGRLRSPMDLFVRTWSSTTACSRCSTSMNWAWWLPGTPGMPAAGMFVTMMEYRQPVAFSKAVRFLAAAATASCGARSTAGHRAIRRPG